LVGPPGRPVGEMRLAPPGPPGWRRSAVALVAILALTSGLPARADDTQTVLLQEFNAYVRLTERTRFFFLASLTILSGPFPWRTPCPGEIPPCVAVAVPL